MSDKAIFKRAEALHEQAMAIAESVYIERRKNPSGDFLYSLANAAYIEAKAATLLPPTKQFEPSRSILFRSAASLAYEAKQYEWANRLIEDGLEGFPPPTIADELKALQLELALLRHANREQSSNAHPKPQLVH